MVPLIATGFLDEFRAEQQAKQDAYLSSYIQEHGYLPSIWYYDAWSRWFMLIGFISAATLIRYLLFIIPYTKQLIKKGNTELKSKLRSMYSIVTLIIIAIVSMGAYTIFKYSYPGYIISILVGMLFGVFISRHSKRNIKEYHSWRDIPYPKENEVSNDIKDSNKNININKSETKIKDSESYEDDLSLAAIKEESRDVEFHKLVETRVHNSNRENLALGLTAYRTFFTKKEISLIEDIIDIWIEYGYKKEFWQTDSAELIDRLAIHVKELFKKNNLYCTDTKVLYTFQMIISNFAYSAVDQPSMLEFIKSETPRNEILSTIDIKENEKLEEPEVEKIERDDIKNAYLETCKSRNNNRQFRELVRLNLTGNDIDSIVSEMAVVSISLSPEVMPLTETVISKWVEFGKKKGFWDLNGSRLFDLFNKNTRNILDNKKIEYNDNDIEYLFQYLLLVLAGSALNDIENQKFMGIE